MTARDKKSTHVELSIDLEPGERVQITLESLSENGVVNVTTLELPAGSEQKGRKRSADISFNIPTFLRTIIGGLKSLRERQTIFSTRSLFQLALVIYLVSRLVGLAAYPANFFCDEAVNSTLAADLVRDGLRDSEGNILPTFFQNDDQYCLGTSVYFQVIPLLLFGQSILVTRGVIVLVSILAALWLAWILRDIFKNPYWWAAPLVLAVMPVWFLYSRAGFEYAYLATFYAGFIYYYLKYRMEQPKYLLAALVCGALAFYSYSPGQVVITVTGVLLLVSDFRYHWANRRTSLAGAGMIGLLALPLVRFLINHPLDYSNRMVMNNSFVMWDLSPGEKILNYLAHYFSGFNPVYWFFPNSYDLVRHRMSGYGFIPWLMLPFIIWGIWLALKGYRGSSNRVLLVGLIAAPSGAALVDVTVHREITIVVPFVLFGVLGFTAMMDEILKRRIVSQNVISYLLVIILGAGSITMLYDSLKNGATWFHQYGIDGLQWGAKEVFFAAEKYEIENPSVTLLISPNWTFQSEVMLRFFIPSPAGIMIGTADRFTDNYDNNLEKFRFVLTPQDYQKIIDSGKFFTPEVEQIIPFPDGMPGFYFVHLTYRENAKELFKKEIEKRALLLADQANLIGSDTPIFHSQLDMGKIDNIFDGDPETLIRSQSINPLIVEIKFPELQRMRGLVFQVGAEPVQISVTVDKGDGSTPLNFTQKAGVVEGRKDIEVPFDRELVVRNLRFGVLDLDSPARSFVHLWEVQLKP